jgi:alpha-glucosidase
MPWSAAAAQAGFSSAEPWLPIPEDHRMRAVSLQQGEPGSVLNFTRDFLHWRRRQPALIGGEIDFLPAPAPLLAFERHCPGQRLSCRFNLGPAPAGGLPGWGWRIG